MRGENIRLVEKALKTLKPGQMMYMGEGAKYQSISNLLNKLELRKTLRLRIGVGKVYLELVDAKNA